MTENRNIDPPLRDWSHEHVCNAKSPEVLKAIGEMIASDAAFSLCAYPKDQEFMTDLRRAYKSQELQLEADRITAGGKAS